VIFRKCENVTDENGKIVTKILPDTDHEVPCDTLLIAAGETIDLSVFGDHTPELNEWHYLKTDEDGKTSLENVWVAGDLRLGARTVVEAAATAKKSALAIDSALMGKLPEALRKKE
jgi:NADPH-dependent glutamate synthase beta subunit-like oxidoreductase